MIFSIIDGNDQFFEYKVLPGEQPDELKLPKWVKASKKRFNEILSIITKAKNNRLKVNVDKTGSITLDNAETLESESTSKKGTTTFFMMLK